MVIALNLIAAVLALTAAALYFLGEYQTSSALWALAVICHFVADHRQ